jgi:hypothetical protein
MPDESLSTTDMLLMTLDNDAVAYHNCFGMAEDAQHNAPDSEEVIAKTWTVEEAVRFQTADSIKEYVENLIDDVQVWGDTPKSLVVATLVRCAFDEVDWHEVADHYLAKLKETRSS